MKPEIKTFYIYEHSSEDFNLNIDEKKTGLNNHQNLKSETQELEHKIGNWERSNVQNSVNFCFNLFFYCFFVPFKIRHNGKSYAIISSSLSHQIICGIVHFTIFFNCILEMRGLSTGKVRENPQQFFVIGERLTTALIFIFYVQMVWFKRDAVLEIFISTSEFEADSKSERKQGVPLVKVGWAFSIIFSVYSFISKFLFPNFYGGLNGLSQRVAFELNFIPFLEDTKLGVTTSVCIFLILRIHKWILIDCIGILNLMVAIVCKKKSTEFKHLLKSQEDLANSSNGLEDEHIFDQYAKLMEYYKRVNRVFGPLYTVSFLGLITSFPSGIVLFLDAEKWTDRFRVGIYSWFPILLFFTAAEAHYQLSYFKIWLLNKPMHSLRHIGNYLAVESRNIGITGHRFFTITYDFIGTAGSVILTYTIITLQFDVGHPNTTTWNN